MRANRHQEQTDAAGGPVALAVRPLSYSTSSSNTTLFGTMTGTTIDTAMITIPGEASGVRKVTVPVCGEMRK